MAKKKSEDKSPVDAMIDELMEKYPESVPDVMTAGQVKRLYLSSPNLNYVFGGGFPLGRVEEMFGPESGGKTVLAASIGGQIQRRTDDGPTRVIYVDVEHTFDINYAIVVGLDPDKKKLTFIHPRNGEEGFEICDRLIQTGEFGLIVWDSIASTPSASVLVSDYGKASFGKTAALFSESLKKFNPYLNRYGTSLLLLNQVRAKIGGQQKPGMPPQENTGGGYAPKFYASWRARVGKTEDIKEGATVIGNKIHVRNVKSKIGFPKRSCDLELYYATGFNPDLEYATFISDLELVDKSGNWYSYKGDRIGQGRPALLDWLRNNRDTFEEMKIMVNESFKRHSVLDEKEVVEEEAEAEAQALDDQE
jgi:recombination protein RecA